jgi:hypothetical protein
MEYVTGDAAYSNPSQLQDNGAHLYAEADLYKDEAMRLLVVLASFAALVGLATPAHAGPDLMPAFWLRPGSLIKADLTPSQSAEGRAI